MKYDYDIFLCYDLSLKTNEGEIKWIESLIYFIGILLGRIRGIKPQIISSKDLSDKNITSDAEIQDICSKTEIFLVLVNPEFKSSSQALKELQILYTTATTADRKQGHVRIFKILKKEIPSSDQPEILNKTLSTEFFIRNKPGTIISADEIEDLTTVETHFWFKLVDLAYEIHNVLRTLSEYDKVIYQGRIIYLAETTSDQNANRDSLKRELQRHGYKVLPDKILPRIPLNLRAEVFDYVGISCLSVHIIGEKYGDLLESSDYSIVDLQNRIAADYFDKVKDIPVKKGGHFFSRIIWKATNLKVEDERQRIFINQLSKEEELIKGADVIDSPIEMLKSIIKQTAEKNILITPFLQQELVEIQTNTKKQIYLIYESQARDEVDMIVKWFYNNGFEIVLPSFKDDKFTSVKSHQEKLSKSDAVLVYFNSINFEWLQCKVNDIIKAPGYGKKKAFLSKAVYIKNNNNNLEKTLKMHNILQIEDQGSLAQKFDTFIKGMN